MPTSTTSSPLATESVLSQPPYPINDEPPKSNHPKPSRFKLTYDIVMIIAISIDLLLISIDAILMSNFSSNAANWLTVSDALIWYQTTLHDPLRTAGGFFTIFLVIELLLRWAIAIKQKSLLSLVLFPFVHWYEVLGCFPQLRALRLLRAVVIGRRLYQLGYQVLPQTWINRIKFYIDLLLEELSDRVILTAIQNFRQELTSSDTHKSFIESTIAKKSKNSGRIVRTAYRACTKAAGTDCLIRWRQYLASEMGNAIEEGLANTPELRRYLRMIPIAGSLIESQLHHVGHNIGENVVNALNKRLLDPKRLDILMMEIASGIAQIDTNNTALDTLISSIIDDSLTAFEAQVKVQQWKHQDILNL
ncbi:LOW QUALITY PROTEIN: hypothetical protein JCM18901_1977 [Psychrobacter sp. JCM 18901]|nr:LOW QUALITY PROTEIN: hypothetical protein JCM18901_1977 [Psychrobacter sp. JCM 18901]